MSDADDETVNRREVAYRLFAAEFEDADLSYSEGDDDRSPNYVVTPTGARVNRLFAVGVLTEVEAVSDDVLRGRIVDPTGAFVAYAGQYQPDEQAFLERVETPTFVAMTGKARTFQPEDSDQVFTSVRPESINEVGAATRDRWTVQTAEQTLDRIGHATSALRLDLSGDALREALLEEGVDESLAAGIPLAFEHYGTTPTYLDALRDLALDAARVVAGERDEVGDLTAAPDQSGPVTARDIPTADVDSGLVDRETSDVTAVETSPDPSTDPGSAEQTESAETTTAEPDSTEVDAEGDSEEIDAETDSDETDTEPDDTGVETDSDGADTESVETGESFGETPADPGDDIGDFDPEEFELEEETREQVKEEHGVEFQTGTEVEDPDDESSGAEDTSADQADTTESSEEAVSGAEDTADSEETETDERVAASEEAHADEDTATAESEGEDDAGAGDRPDDLQAAVVELMGELDDGDGASRDDLVAEMEGRYGVGEDDTDDAVQDALMDGECYEPGDGRYKPI